MTATELICRRVVPVATDITTFEFESVDARPTSHLPGQYLTVTVDVDGVPVDRSYSISSPPSRPYRVAITVKREPGGLVSGWLHDRLRTGDTVHAHGPYGEFTTGHRPAGKYLLLAGGVGITPMISMVRTMHDLGHGLLHEHGGDPDVVLIHNARTPAHLAFRAELEFLAAALPGLEVRAMCDDVGDGSWPGRVGPLSVEVLAEVTDLAEREVFLCGPPGYVTASLAILERAGVDDSRIHTESFAPAAAAPPVPVVPVAAGDAASDTDFAVEFRKSGRTVRCGPQTSVLAAALAAGLRIPSSCGAGLCGTCKTTLLSGSVDMQHSGGIRPREINQDKFLPCCSTPREDLVIDS